MIFSERKSGSFCSVALHKQPELAVFLQKSKQSCQKANQIGDIWKNSWKMRQAIEEAYLVMRFIQIKEDFQPYFWSLLAVKTTIFNPKIISFQSHYNQLERALRALASFSGGAACPGGTRGQHRGSTPGVRGWFQGDLSEKKILWRTDERTDGWTDRRAGRNSDLD